MRAVVGRVEQQHNRDRHQCNGSNKDTKHCTHSSRQELSPKDEEAPGEASPGASWIVNWVHPPIQRYCSRNLATQSCAVCGSDASQA
jgi:hypothetical protein